MTVTIVNGWWMLPLGVTIAAWLWSFIWTQGSSSHGIGAIVDLMAFLMATAVSLAAWLVWAIFI